MTPAIPDLLPLARAVAFARRAQSAPPRRRPSVAFFAALVMGLFALAACRTVGPQPITPIRIDAAQVARMISAFRAENGLASVTRRLAPDAGCRRLCPRHGRA